MESSPFLARAMVIQSCSITFKAKKSEFYPKIVAVASVGEMASAKLVQKKDYSGGIGIVLPLFDFHTPVKFNVLRH